MSKIPYSKKELYRMDKKFFYEGRKTREISFPLGGIGTGCIGLAGNGALIDWEIFNRPNKSWSTNGFSFFAIKVEKDKKIVSAKVLHGDLQPPYTGFLSSSDDFSSTYGFGPKRELLAGLPHFERTRFGGEFPFSEIEFLDEKFPLKVTMEAFNPFIPLNDKDSSLPCAIFSFDIENLSKESFELSLVGSLSNSDRTKPLNQYREEKGIKGMFLTSSHWGKDDAGFGNLTLSTDAIQTSKQDYWHHEGWFERLQVFWDEFTQPGELKDRRYSESRDKIESEQMQEVALLCAHENIAPGEVKTIRFLISWYFPNFVKYWKGHKEALPEERPTWKNYYATLFEDSHQVACYVFSNFDRLRNQSWRFKETLFRSTLPDHVIEAVASNLSVLKSPTCLRLEDGTFYGFEGSRPTAGSCEGSCTHVWNYEQAIPFLFPSLCRSMYEINYRYNQYKNGYMRFRLSLPPSPVEADDGHAAADGQLGNIVKVYELWKVTGNTRWLKTLWPKLKKALEYAWEPTNKDGWDSNKDGVLEGVQHHTLDVEIYGPNSYIASYYLAALLASSRMADALGETGSAREYLELFYQGREWVNEHLFNGEYYYQKIDLTDTRGIKDESYIDPESGQVKYQFGEGCHSDQIIGQWYAHITGLGYVLDEEKVKKAISSVYKNNFIYPLREHSNACRIYGLKEEKGLLICTWPKGNRPRIPVLYADECMNGFEYQVASHLIYEGFIEEGLTVAKAVRERYDGEKRNPWNEFECGSNYARSLASFALLLALSGFEYDLIKGLVGFNPQINPHNFYCFWSLGYGWGYFKSATGKLELGVLYGKLSLLIFQSDILKEKEIKRIDIDGKLLKFKQDEKRVVFEKKFTVKERSVLRFWIE